MKEELERWRSQIRGCRPGAGRSRPNLYEQVGVEVVALCRRAQAEGMSWSQLEGALGVSSTTLRKWAEKTPARWRSGSGGNRGKSPQALIPVQVAAVEARPMEDVGALMLIGPSGFRLEGLSPALAVQMMRELA